MNQFTSKDHIIGAAVLAVAVFLLPMIGFAGAYAGILIVDGIIKAMGFQ